MEELMPPSAGPVLGILGGLGPAATADFLAKIVEHTDAKVDQEHIATLTYQDPTTPDRTTAILNGGASPLPSLLHGVKFLNDSGVSAIAIPCNSSHYWYEQIAEESGVPVINIVDAVADEIEAGAEQIQVLGLLATEGTSKAGVYSALEERDFTVIHLADTPDNPVTRGIHAVKAGDIEEGRRLFEESIEELKDRGAEGIIFGCTEVSTALGGTNLNGETPMWDSSEALAKAAVARFGKLKQQDS